MTQEEINEGNKLIAEFMGELFEGKEYKLFKYHSSWDWLMPVIRKAKCSINSADYSGWNLLNLYLQATRIEDVYFEIVRFIKWYNSLTTNNKQND